MRTIAAGMRVSTNTTHGDGLPNLVGAPLEIAWAQTIRQTIVDDFESFLAECEPNHTAQVSALREAFAAVVLRQTEARRFIENHDLDLLRPRLSRQLMGWIRLNRPEVVPKPKPSPSAQLAAIDSSTPAIIRVAFGK